jgi:hypothetical protein
MRSMVAVIVLMLVGVALSTLIWRLQACLLRWQQHDLVARTTACCSFASDQMRAFNSKLDEPRLQSSRA